jgi:hypothetical protein
MASPILGAQRVPRVSLTTFAEYVTSSASARIDCVRDQQRIYGKPYHPGPSFYQAFTDGVIRGLRTGASDLAMQTTVRAQRDEARRQHYTALAPHWLALTGLHRPLATHSHALWLTPRLAVGVRPDFAVLDTDGKAYTVKLWLKDRELADDAAKAMLRLFERHMTDICPGATPLVADVRRDRVYRPTRRPLKSGFDAWLEAEARGLAELWDQLAAA